MSIFTDISPMLNEFSENKIVAHSDAYPTYVWKLKDQFDHNQEKYYKILSEKINLNIDYFQTTIMLYDTKIIEPETFQNLINLLLEFPISITNDQGIIALYFTCINPHFKQLKIYDDDTYYYDYLSRGPYKYIMLKNLSRIKKKKC